VVIKTHSVVPALLQYWRLGPSDFNKLEVSFGHAAVRADPRIGNINPQCSGGNTVLGATVSFIVKKAANDANIGFHIFAV
jgi:hypothetical protein